MMFTQKQRHKIYIENLPQKVKTVGFRSIRHNAGLEGVKNGMNISYHNQEIPKVFEEGGTYLDEEKICRLNFVLKEIIRIHFKLDETEIKEEFPLMRFLFKMIENFQLFANVRFDDIVLHKDSAEFVFKETTNFIYTNIELMFQIKSSHFFVDEITEDVLRKTFIEFFPMASEPKFYSYLMDNFLLKITKVSENNERWSSFRLVNMNGHDIKLMFVENFEHCCKFGPVASPHIFLNNFVTISGLVLDLKREFIGMTRSLPQDLDDDLSPFEEIEKDILDKPFVRNRITECCSLLELYPLFWISRNNFPTTLARPNKDVILLKDLSMRDKCLSFLKYCHILISSPNAQLNAEDVRKYLFRFLKNIPLFSLEEQLKLWNEFLVDQYKDDALSKYILLTIVDKLIAKYSKQLRAATVKNPASETSSFFVQLLQQLILQCYQKLIEEFFQILSIEELIGSFTTTIVPSDHADSMEKFLKRCRWNVWDKNFTAIKIRKLINIIGVNDSDRQQIKVINCYPSDFDKIFTDQESINSPLRGCSQYIFTLLPKEVFPSNESSPYTFDHEKIKTFIYNDRFKNYQFNCFDEEIILLQQEVLKIILPVAPPEAFRLTLMIRRAQNPINQSFNDCLMIVPADYVPSSNIETPYNERDSNLISEMNMLTENCLLRFRELRSGIVIDQNRPTENSLDLRPDWQVFSSNRSFVSEALESKLREGYKYSCVYRQLLFDAYKYRYILGSEMVNSEPPRSETPLSVREFLRASKRNPEIDKITRRLERFSTSSRIASQTPRIASQTPRIASQSPRIASLSSRITTTSASSPKYLRSCQRYNLRYVFKLFVEIPSESGETSEYKKIEIPLKGNIFENDRIVLTYVEKFQSDVAIMGELLSDPVFEPFFVPLEVIGDMIARYMKYMRQKVV
ncbi:hypothetical protein QR98_0021040 [Sarcoptes scabiei]|uniref:polynucleotide adenylyltransferase n=1 Tax=Sarcoptes scabiei TaxID=52283 RepID=A0A131ZZY6_SARSC|nr:hypothetical protein QR98_0021040 [Sarcoptes scabiei]